jgi:hypothetical protein
MQPPLEEFGERPFSFYPPILNVEHNEWQFLKSSWSELLVRNTGKKLEVWIPRQVVGEISRIEDPVMIVGLLKELEYRAGTVWPTQRRVIHMPKGAGDVPPRTEQEIAAEPAPPANPITGFQGGTESRIGKLILGALVIGLVLCVLVISIFQGKKGGRVEFSAVMQSDLNLRATDDYFDVIRKLGQPKGDHWRSEVGEMQYRVMEYPDKGIKVILMGIERDKAHYVGAMDKDWKVVNSVLLPGGADSRPMLLKLQRF